MQPMDNKYWVVFGAHSGAIYEPMLYYTNLQANAKKNIAKGISQQICFFFVENLTNDTAVNIIYSGNFLEHVFTFLDYCA